MPTLRRLIRLVLILHALANIAQGLFCLYDPSTWARQAGEAYTLTAVPVIQSIGMSAPP